MIFNKLIYTLLASLLFISSLAAQTPKWVSTEIQNRTAVLENLTGVCWVPYAAAHKKANEFLKLYPENFVIINIYHGDLADPSIIKSLEYDLSTDEGKLIYEESAYQGFEFGILNNIPSGSINRSTYPWAMYYSGWDTTVKNIINQKSPVNVYIKPEINFTTRELTVEVEYYYTDDSPSDENYLTVMLLQNEIVDYQQDGLENNPEYVVTYLNDILYRHMHVLRKIISKGGTWGDKITNTKKGSYECRKYSLILPDSIKNVPLYLTNLEVAAFIAERDSNIYTGHRAIVEIPAKLRTNLAVEDITEYNNDIKFEPIHPKIKVTNKSDLPVTNFDIAFTLANTQTFLNLSTNKYFKIYDTLVILKDEYSGKLEKGESAIFEFPEITRSYYKIASNYVTNASVSNIYNNETLL
ncbi:MAG: Omp28-related outer membrane protein, partial [Bacteroidetes bacterium]|nr:Omp28-related outer membrane protein [Bacteroidota bacterium]